MQRDGVRRSVGLVVRLALVAWRRTRDIVVHGVDVALRRAINDAARRDGRRTLFDNVGQVRATRRRTETAARAQRQVAAIGLDVRAAIVVVNRLLTRRRRFVKGEKSLARHVRLERHFDARRRALLHGRAAHLTTAHHFGHRHFDAIATVHDTRPVDDAGVWALVGGDARGVGRVRRAARGGGVVEQNARVRFGRQHHATTCGAVVNVGATRVRVERRRRRRAREAARGASADEVRRNGDENEHGLVGRLKTRSMRSVYSFLSSTLRLRRRSGTPVTEQHPKSTHWE